MANQRSHPAGSEERSFCSRPHPPGQRSRANLCEPVSWHTMYHHYPEGRFSLPAIAGKQQAPMDWQAFWLTIRLAVLVAAVLAVLGLPVAYWIAYSRWRWKFLAEALVALPIVLPPTVLGFYVLVALGSRSPFGRWWQALTGHTLAFTFAGLVIGSIVYSLPFAVQPFAASFAAVDVRLIAASSTLGASKPRTFFRVILPLSVPGVVTGVALSFAHTMGEFGVVLMVGGNIPGVTRTVSIDIYDQTQALNYSAANQTALLLLAISFLVLAGVYALNRKVWVGWTWK
jgi:molybdate transport system permease protein